MSSGQWTEQWPWRDAFRRCASSWLLLLGSCRWVRWQRSEVRGSWFLAVWYGSRAAVSQWTTTLITVFCIPPITYGMKRPPFYQDWLGVDGMDWKFVSHTLLVSPIERPFSLTECWTNPNTCRCTVMTFLFGGTLSFRKKLEVIAKVQCLNCFVYTSWGLLISIHRDFIHSKAGCRTCY